MEKFMQIKKNHHYVWAYYLKSWADENKELFYISKKGKISKDNIKGLAKDTSFYKIHSLNNEDINFIKQLSAISPKFLRDIHNSQLKFFQKLLFIENFPINPKYSKEYSLLVEAIKSNSLENTYTIVERLALEVISELVQGNSMILKDKKCLINFLYYIGHQITRTKAFKDKCLAALKDDGRLFNLWEKNWWFVSYMLGINLGHSLYQNNTIDTHIFIENNTNIPFITSDSPAVNIHSSLEKLKENESPQFMDLYFPLSPKYAYMICDSNDYENLKDFVSEKDVVSLNERIYTKSHKTVFSNPRRRL
ncbi:DUF4238 domain-containing protein [Sulfurospirillum sp. T05]|uniref:DUF4238 domain-containing protein n=1 Tax=Sulfurospirillum tamanense TaxID=2813362 RepID=A0ABS2WV76_9BACT|nr:DUF4238 domain-containing protein [Sulfurospirillum tamanensis]MBN2965561.1 DUF4238 domain-containing protein [Sulfurospirillum tamanensis]